MNDPRELRLHDFDMRARVEPGGLYEDESIGSYILVHPLAGEVDELKRLGVSPDSCAKADCYWKHDQDVYFLQVETTRYTQREPGLWARISTGEPSYVNLVGIVDEDVVTRTALHRIMWLFQTISIRSLQLGQTLRRVDPKFG